MPTGLSAFPFFPWFAPRRGLAKPWARAAVVHRVALHGLKPCLVDARAGWQLQVLQGRVWLTQPGALQDLFLSAGDSVTLNQAGVLLQAEPLVPRGRCQEARALCELRRLSL